jgi:hypothetical protein
MNFLPEIKYGVPSHNFVKKNVLCEKGDEITRFDGRGLAQLKRGCGIAKMGCGVAQVGCGAAKNPAGYQTPVSREAKNIRGKDTLFPAFLT